MEQDDHGKRAPKWEDWDNEDKYKPDDDWGYKSESDSRWKSWDSDMKDERRDRNESDGATRPTSASSQSWQAAYREAGPFLDIGLHLATTIVMALVVFLGGGAWLDRRFELAPALTIVGALLAFVVIGYRFYAGVRQLIAMESRKNKQSDSQSPPQRGQKTTE